MPNYCRKLVTDMQVEQFVDEILCIENDSEKGAAINLITQAERNIKDYPMYPTLTHRDNRDYKYREEPVRKKLRKQIVDELFHIQRLDNDDDISIDHGGAAPKTGVKSEGKAFYIIGPPASGKSSVAAKLADEFGCFILDSDFAKRKLPEFTNQIGAASLVHEESDDLIFGEQGLITKCVPLRHNIVIPKIGHNIDSVIDFCSALKNAGYKVFLISVDLDRQKATQRAYNRFVKTKRYIPLSLIFDGYGNQPTLNYFKIKQKYSDIFAGFAQISTDVKMGEPLELVEAYDIDGIESVDWR